MRALMMSSNIVQPTYRTFTIVWQEIENPANAFLRYEDDASGLTQGSSAFDTFFGYSGVRLGTLSTVGEETATVNLSSMSTETGLNQGDNVMVKFPMRGIKMSKSSDQVTLSITDEPNKTGFQYYAFTRGTTIKDKMYLGCYLGTFSNYSGSSVSASGGYLKSYARSYVQNANPAANQTLATFRTRARNNGTGYDVMGWYQWNYINALYMMKYGNPRNQNVVGMGLSGGSGVAGTGATNSVNSATGATTTADTGRIKIFGLEDWWGNAYSWLDGCWYNSNSHMTVTKTNDNFQSSAYSTDLGAGVTGYMKAIHGTNDAMFYSKDADLTLTTGDKYYTDNFGIASTGDRPVCSGGYYNGGVGNGAFRISHTPKTTTAAYLSARLMFL